MWVIVTRTPLRQEGAIRPLPRAYSRQAACHSTAGVPRPVRADRRTTMNQITRTTRGKQDQPTGPPQSIAHAVRVAALALWRTIQRHRVAAKLIAQVVAAV